MLTQNTKKLIRKISREYKRVEMNILRYYSGIVLGILGTRLSRKERKDVHLLYDKVINELEKNKEEE